MRLRKTGIRPHSFGQMKNSLLVLPLVQENIPKIIMGFCIIRVDAQGFDKMRNSLLVLPLLQENMTKLRLCQVRFRETSASEPLMRCRKLKDDVETGGVHHSRISPGENLFTAWAASGIKVA